jgi:hypothetical protein
LVEGHVGAIGGRGFVLEDFAGDVGSLVAEVEVGGVDGIGFLVVIVGVVGG